MNSGTHSNWCCSCIGVSGDRYSQRWSCSSLRRNGNKGRGDEYGGRKRNRARFYSIQRICTRERPKVCWQREVMTRFSIQALQHSMVSCTSEFKLSESKSKAPNTHLSWCGFMACLRRLVHTCLGSLQACAKSRVVYWSVKSSRLRNPGVLFGV